MLVTSGRDIPSSSIVWFAVALAQHLSAGSHILEYSVQGFDSYFNE